MKHDQKLTSRALRRDGCWNALQKLDAAVERNTGGSSAEVMRQMRQAYFADVDELERAGEIKLPE
jgi:hypothetical protein